MEEQAILQHIKEVKLVKGAGEGIIGFYLKIEDEEMLVPIESSNRHYQLIKLWYKNQSKKPFDFDFD